jgi:hypothetical protein
MKKRLPIYIAITFLATLIFMPIGIAQAVDVPDTLTISEAQVTEDNYETGDQLYIIPFEIGFCNTSDYTASDLFIIRLLDDGVEIASGTPYSFYNNGFSSGCIGFYFSALDADLPTWATANLSVEIISNPVATWNGTTPYISSNSFNWASSASYVAIKIRSLAQQFENEWSIDLIEPVNGINQLTDYGEAYFDSTIPNLRVIASILFVSSTKLPVYSETDNNTTYQDLLQAQAIASFNGTVSGNITTTANVIGGISPNALLTLMWTIGGLILIGCVGFAGAKLNPQGVATGQTLIIRSSLAIFCLWMLFGTVYKYVILQVGIGIAVIAVLGIVFTFFFKGSSY